MSNTIGYDLEGFANSSVTSLVTTSVSSDIDLYLPFDSDLNDDSTNSHTVTNSGSVAVSTSVKKYGAGSADIPAAADYLEISGGQFEFGSNDFTIEGWFYDDGSGGSRNVALDYRLSGGGAAGSGSETFGFFFYLNNSGNSQFFIGLEGDAAVLGYWPMFSSSSLAISTNTWTHYAITREGSTFRAFKDGSLIATQTGVTAAVGASTGAGAILRIGGGHDGSSSYGMAGYIDDLRIINGTALYTAAFTPPTSAVGLTAEVTNTIVDQKFLSSVWDSDDVSEKMADGTWIRNDVTSGANPAGVVVQGAGLQDENHRWYVAPDVTSTTLKAWGAGGGGNSNNPGGGGGFTVAEYEITPGTQLTVQVGGGGGSDTRSGGPGLGGAHGGGSSAGNGAGGGGYSGVFIGPASQANALVIAGGGGGDSSHSPSPSVGGTGGGSTGGTGSSPVGGTGGSQVAGGIGGNGAGNGSALQGGGHTDPATSGGGGGYYGGGAGGDGGSSHGGGGGGSGFFRTSSLPPAVTYPGTDASTTTGFESSVAGSSDPDYVSGKGNGGDSAGPGTSYDAEDGFIVITDPSGTYTFTSPGTHTVS